MSRYLLSENKKQKIDTVISSQVIDLTEGRRRSRPGSFARPSGGKYSGYFTVTDASNDETVQVAISAGRCRINISDFYVSGQNKTVTATGYVYLKATADEDGTVAAPTIEFIEIGEGEDVPPGYEDSVFNGLLAKITVSDDAITSIEQIQYGFLYSNAWGDCSA